VSRSRLWAHIVVVGTNECGVTAIAVALIQLSLLKSFVKLLNTLSFYEWQ
jgi:hypothetical protein